jgi:hypothetical protein
MYVLKRMEQNFQFFFGKKIGAEKKFTTEPLSTVRATKGGQ